MFKIVNFVTDFIISYIFFFIHFNYFTCWMFSTKLDGVGPVDNTPSTDKLHHFVKKKKNCDMWYVTCDTWYVTCDMWLVWGGEHSLKISAPLLLRFVIYDIMKIWRKRMTDSLNELMNGKAVYRTAPATPGLLKKVTLRGQKTYNIQTFQLIDWIGIGVDSVIFFTSFNLTYRHT